MSLGVEDLWPLLGLERAALQPKTHLNSPKGFEADLAGGAEVSGKLGVRQDLQDSCSSSVMNSQCTFLGPLFSRHKWTQPQGLLKSHSTCGFGQELAMFWTFPEPY